MDTAAKFSSVVDSKVNAITSKIAEKLKEYGQAVKDSVLHSPPVQEVELRLLSIQTELFVLHDALKETFLHEGRNQCQFLRQNGTAESILIRTTSEARVSSLAFVEKLVLEQGAAAAEAQREQTVREKNPFIQAGN